MLQELELANTDVEDLNSTIIQHDLTDIFRTLHPTIVKYTLFSSAHGTLKIHHVLDPKTKLNKIKSSEIVQSILSDQNGIELELNNLINDTLLNNLWIENILN